MRRHAATRLLVSGAALAWALTLGLWTQAYAQSNTGTIRGFVRDNEGNPVANASVVAVQEGTNFQRGALSTGTGFYNLPGLTPGTYTVTASSLGFAETQRTVRVLIGQTLGLDVTLSVEAIALEGLEATVGRIVETTTPEVATNITPEQIEALPMNDRNFLSFAQLAPGISFGCANCPPGDDGGLNVGASSANNVNVFIDGVSFKNDILKGGIAGQDASKGNPFPQVAVQEFRVITQQYKAEYQKASSAVVTAQTKSGTNEFKVAGFGFRQDKGLIEQNFIQLRTCRERQLATPPLPCVEQAKQDRWQLGGSLGGPIVRDKLFFFGAYEGNYQDRAATVTVGNQIDNWPTAIQQELRSHEGTFPSEFRSNLFFGKLTYVPNQEHRLEFSGNIRDEFDVRNFGGFDALENAEDFNNDVNTALLKHQFSRGNLLNEAQVSFQRYRWFPIQLNPDIPGRRYVGGLKIGGRCCPQDQTQRRFELKNDLSYTVPNWFGDHVFKVGGSVAFIEYDIIKQLNVNPQFIFEQANPDRPDRVEIGFGTPNIGADNKQYGIYAQDDWSLSRRLILNLGVRWDYETNGLNNDYVTPANVVSELSALADSLVIFNPRDYFTDGNDRPGYKGMIQPRVGFSYDLSGRNSTVLHGGFGIYYDRNSFATTIGERERLVWTTYLIRFSDDGSAPNTVAWNPAFLGPNGREILQSQIQTGTFGKPEVFLLRNDTEPPRANQYSLGVRQTWRDLLFSLNYSGVRGYNEFTWHFANRRDPGVAPNLFETPSFRNVLVSTNEGRSWYDAFLFKVERPYTRANRWGGQIAYTLSWADDNFSAGRDFAGLDFRTPDDFVRRESERDERHRVTANAIVGLPFDIRASGILNLGSGRKFRAFYGGNSCLNGNQDCLSNEYPVNGVIDGTFGGTDPFTGDPIRNSFLGIGGWAFRNVDLRLEKEFGYRGNHVTLIGEVFNIFNYDNFAGYDGFIADLTPTNTLANIRHPALGCVENPATVAQECSFGRPNAVVADTRLTGAPRRFQFGLQYRMD